MLTPAGYFWKRAPVIRVFLPFAVGIASGWYLHPPLLLSQVILISAWFLLVITLLLPSAQRFRLALFNGLVVCLLFAATGSACVYAADVRHDRQGFESFSGNANCFIARIEEPLVEKPRSFKTRARLLYVGSEQQFDKVNGQILLYLQKDSSLACLNYGTLILFVRPPQPVSNTGKPGGFDFKRYCLFQGITHQVYLRPPDIRVLSRNQGSLYQRMLYPLQQKIVRLLRSYVPGNQEAGLAEALLIGYKNDLDKSLVQSYSNTGVVHVIAISGLHLGLVYWLLLIFLRPFRNLRGYLWFQPVIIILGLWSFSLLAGGQASVLRSALMFSCLTVGQALGRKTAAYNTLAFSAFLLLCYDPFLLWDAGFQLSYAAVLSIMIFQRSVSNWFYFQNRIIEFIWQLCAVTLAAQLLTLPFTLYYFHQLPSYFLLANVLAVPLSSIIVLGEIGLCLLGFWPSAAGILGSLIAAAIRFMNAYIARIGWLPGASLAGISFDLAQAFLLTLFVAGIGWWLLEKFKWGFFLSGLSLLGLLSIGAIHRVQTAQQRKIVVYHIPGRLGVELMEGNQTCLLGDQGLTEETDLFSYYLQPARIYFGVVANNQGQELLRSPPFYSWKGRHMLVMDTFLRFQPAEKRMAIDLLIVSGSARFNLVRLSQSMEIRQLVFAGIKPSRRLQEWKKDADSLGIPGYDTGEKGAFVMNLN